MQRLRLLAQPVRCHCPFINKGTLSVQYLAGIGTNLPHKSRAYSVKSDIEVTVAKPVKKDVFPISQPKVNHDPRVALVVDSHRNFEHHLFDVLKDANGKVPISAFVAGLRDVGFRITDPRLRSTITKIRELQTSALGTDEQFTTKDLHLDRQTFYECTHDNMTLIQKAYTSDLIIPKFTEFTELVNDIYWKCFGMRHGKVASYIPQLSRYSPEYWGVSVCTVDGQRHSIGDVRVPFSLQSGSKAVSYALALNDLGEDVVHQYVGHEPSGHSFNHIKLGHGNKPHNPMINAGSIVIASLVKNNLNLADRFDYVSKKFKKMAGGEFIGFNNAIFLSERETADRNMALAYYLKENKCFPEGINLQDTMDFYFQLCSTEVDCDSASVMASTLANGGICPTTGESLLDGEAVRNTLSLMHSCGMYDYSGEFAFKVGLPAKSGVSGVIMLVVPNVCGFCLWSPPIDSYGNSVRALAFCEELVKVFNFHNYDNLRHLSSQKRDPRIRSLNYKGLHVVKLLTSACHGDLNGLKRMWLSGKDMEAMDYDGRTALHLVAAEGHCHSAKFLLEICQVNPNPQDRWGHTPYDDAVCFKRTELVNLLSPYRNSSATDTDAIGKNIAGITLDSTGSA